MFKPTLEGILGGLTDTLAKLNEFVDDGVKKEAEIADEIFTLEEKKSAVTTKVNRASRVAGKLKEILK